MGKQAIWYVDFDGVMRPYYNKSDCDKAFSGVIDFFNEFLGKGGFIAVVTQHTGYLGEISEAEALNSGMDYKPEWAMKYEDLPTKQQLEPTVSSWRAEVYVKNWLLSDGLKRECLDHIVVVSGRDDKYSCEKYGKQGHIDYARKRVKKLIIDPSVSLSEAFVDDTVCNILLTKTPKVRVLLPISVEGSSDSNLKDGHKKKFFAALEVEKFWGEELRLLKRLGMVVYTECMGCAAAKLQAESMGLCAIDSDVYLDVVKAAEKGAAISNTAQRAIFKVPHTRPVEADTTSVFSHHDLDDQDNSVNASEADVVEQEEVVITTLSPAEAALFNRYIREQNIRGQNEVVTIPGSVEEDKDEKFSTQVTRCSSSGDDMRAETREGFSGFLAKLSLFCCCRSQPPEERFVAKGSCQPKGR